jgi:hypothetical protein
VEPSSALLRFFSLGWAIVLLCMLGRV